jgi:type I restriction enzyme S subunit
MSNKWKYDKLSNLCLRIGDGLHGTPQYSDDTGYFFINGNNLRNGKIEISQDTKTVNEVEYKNNYIALDGRSLLLGINGSIGNMAFYNNEKVMLGKSSAYLNFKTGINKFFYYYFQLKSIQKYFYDVATGSTIKNLSLQSLQDFIVPVPEENEWEKIASVLSSLDSKIELNNRLNAELEQMAKTLYNYWFVQFDFPNKNGKPYKTSGGKMIYNNELKKEIPEGWEVRKISNLLSVLTGKQDANFATENGKYNFFTCGEEILKCDSFEFEGKTILLAGNGNFNIKLYEGKFNAYQRTYVLIPTNDNHYTVVYLAVKDRIKSLTSGSRGSIVKFITKGDIENITVVLPKSDFSNQYNQLNTITKKIELNIAENQKLAELRDWLLPMLMNGQITVK